MNYTNFSSRKSFAWKLFFKVSLLELQERLEILETQPKISFILSLLRLIAKVQVNVFACSAAISACAKTSNWRQAMSLLEKANEVQVELNVGISLALGSGEPTLSSISCFRFFCISDEHLGVGSSICWMHSCGHARKGLFASSLVSWYPVCLLSQV